MYKKLALIALIFTITLCIVPVNAAYFTNSSFGMTDAKSVPNGTDYIYYGDRVGIFGASGITSELVACSDQGSGYISNVIGWNVAHQNTTGIPPVSQYYGWDAICDYGNASYFVIMNNDGLSGLGGYKGPIVASWRLFTAAAVPVTFKATNTTSPLDGVTVTIVGQTSGTTDVNGNLTLTVPASSSYTYRAVKSGYSDSTGSIGAAGQYGGTIYFTMLPGVGTTTTRTYLHAVDSAYGSHISGATINAYCNGTWKNETTANGVSYIDCPNAATFDIYGSATNYADAYDTGVLVGGNYYLSMLSNTTAAPVGYSKIFVTVQDADTNDLIKYASVSASLPTGSVQGDSTGSSGTTYFTVPNNTVVIFVASKSGYTSLSKSLNSGTGTNIQTTLKLSKTTVATTGTPAPYVTDPSTGLPVTDASGNYVTPAPTYLPGCDPNSPDYSAEDCSKAQDSSFMAKLRDWAPTILDLAIAAILFGLLAAIFGAMQKMTKW